MKRKIEIFVRYIVLATAFFLSGLFFTNHVYAWETGEIILQFFANSNSAKDTGHSWLGIVNNSLEAISIGPYQLGAGETVYLGGRGDRDASSASYAPAKRNFDGGAFFNYESAIANEIPDYYRSFSYIEKKITVADLDIIYSHMKQFQDYDVVTNNCNDFAKEVWNSVSNQTKLLIDGVLNIPRATKDYLNSHANTLDTKTGTVLADFGKTYQDVYYVSPNGYLQPWDIPAPENIKISNVTVNTTSRNVEISWSKVKSSGITGYEVFCHDENNIDTTYSLKNNATSCTVKLENSVSYYIAVRAISDRTSEDGIYSASEYGTGVMCPKLTVSLDTHNKTAYVNKSFVLEATPSDELDGTLEWTSSDTSIAVVNNGTVTPKKTGKTTITVTFKVTGIWSSAIIQDSCEVTVKSSKPAKQGITKVENVVDGIRISWPKSTNAEGYKILRKANNGTWKIIKTIKDIAAVQYIDTETNNGVLYTYTVKGYIGDILSEYNKTGLKMYRLSRVYITECKSPAGGKAKLVLSKRGVADGYYVYYSQSSKFETFTKKQIVGADNTSVTLSGLAKGKTYYFKIRPYKIIDGKTYYGVPSAVKNVKIKNPVIDITKASIRINKGKTYTLAVTLTDISKSKVEWASSDTSVAKVNSDGVVTGMKVGTSTITASGDGASDTCKVTVVAIPSDAKQYNNRWYKLYKVGKKWTEANAACKNLGGHLVTITSAAEQSFCISLLQNINRCYCWIGAKKVNGNWRWVTGETWKYTAWQQGQPNDSGGGGYTYLQNYPEGSWTWDDQNNTGMSPDPAWAEAPYYQITSNFVYICEWEPLSS